MTESEWNTRKENIDKIGKVVFGIYDSAKELASRGGTFCGMRRAEIPQAMIIDRLDESNRLLKEILEEMRK